MHCFLCFLLFFLEGGLNYGVKKSGNSFMYPFKIMPPKQAISRNRKIGATTRLGLQFFSLLRYLTVSSIALLWNCQNWKQHENANHGSRNFEISKQDVWLWRHANVVRCLMDPWSIIIYSFSVSSSDKKLIVDLHNKFRSQVNPTAKNMMKMVRLAIYHHV